MKKYRAKLLYLLIMTLVIISCGLSTPELVSEQHPVLMPSSIQPTTESKEAVDPVSTHVVSVVEHLIRPTDAVPIPESFVDDVESSGTAVEKRAPYGDSFDLNRFERPFLDDMTYVPDLDIHRFGLSQDDDWYYITILLIGNDPNNALGINYGVELDQNADGYGDYIIWSNPPFSLEWDTSTVQIFMDTDKDTGGLSAVKSDGIFAGNGYDKLIFDGGTSQNDDPDLAWVRWIEGSNAELQFAIKKTWMGSTFLYGVVADAGLKDVSMYDYTDRFTPAEAGSPVRGKEEYPLGSLYAVDNTCWDAYGFKSTGYEPKICPPIIQPVIKPDHQPSGCDPAPDCANGYDPDTCGCL